MNRIFFYVFLLLVLQIDRDVSADEKVPERPNILICMGDDVSYPYMSANGCTWIKTPGFDRVANEGIRFTRAYTPNAKCAPSRACFLTGRNPWQLEEACNHIPYFPVKFTTYPEALSRHGYFVGCTEKGWAPGVALDAKGIPRQLTGIPFNAKRLTPPTKQISKNDYTGNFNDFLDAKPGDTPWCFWYGCIEPHRGYEYGTGTGIGGKSISDIDRVPEYWPDNEVVRNDMLDFAFELEYFDKHIVRILRLLEDRNELNNTIVIVTADNGMPFPRAKGQSYEMSCHLPFAVMWKNGIKNPGRVVDDYVSFIDIVPTLLELAGLTTGQAGMQSSTGKSLLPIFSSDRSGQVDTARDSVLLGRERNDIGRPNDEGYPIRAIVRNDMMYQYNFEPDRWPACNPETGYLDVDGSPTKTEILKARKLPDQERYWKMNFAKRGHEEMYCLKTDPDCIRNLILDPAYSKQAAQLKAELFLRLKEQEDPRISGKGNLFDEYPHANKGTRNFYNRYMNGEKLRAGWVNPTDFETNSVQKN